MKYVCYCNRVLEEQVVQALAEGKASNLSEIYDVTGAGNGPCGGSCRPKLLRMLAEKKAADLQENGPQPNRESCPSDSLLEAMSYFNRRFYWEAHEVLEKVWKEADGQEKDFYQGLIQGAAAYYHVMKGNAQSSLKLAKMAIEKLESISGPIQGFETEVFLLALKKLVKESKEVLGNIRSGFSYEALPKWTLKKGMNV